MKFLVLLIGLQTFAVILDSFWKHTGVICRTVNSIPRKIHIWSVEENSCRGSDRTIETYRTFSSNQYELPASDRCEPWKASECCQLDGISALQLACVMAEYDSFSTGMNKLHTKGQSHREGCNAPSRTPCCLLTKADSRTSMIWDCLSIQTICLLSPTVSTKRTTNSKPERFALDAVLVPRHIRFTLEASTMASVTLKH